VFEQFLMLLVNFRNVDTVVLRPDKNWHIFPAPNGPWDPILSLLLAEFLPNPLAQRMLGCCFLPNWRP
jgi:hypothetical protein